MKLQSLIPNEVWVSPSVHIKLTSLSTSNVGLLYGAILPSHIQVTHFLQYPSLERQQLQNWEKSYQKELLKHQDAQKVGWYTKGKKQRSYQQLETCKNYQKCLPQSFFLMIDIGLEFPYLAYRIKRSFLNREVFGIQELDKINPFNELQVKIKEVVGLSSQYLISKTNKNKEQQPSNRIKLIQQYIEATTQTKKLPTQNQVMIEEQFTQQLTYKLTQKQYKKRLEEQNLKQKQAEDLLNDLWD